MRASIALLFVVASGLTGLVVACTDQVNPTFSKGSSLVDGGDDSAVTDTGVTDDAATDAGSGKGTISGAVGGKPFTSVMSAYWIGAPDLATTTAIYLIGKPLTCADLATSGWSRTITAGTPIFEMLLTTKTPAVASYAVSTATSPPVGSAEVQYIVAAPARNETRATTGTIMLTQLIATSEAVGTFNVQFGAADGGDAGDAGASSLSGTFTAAYCAGGHEP